MPSAASKAKEKDKKAAARKAGKPAASSGTQADGAEGETPSILLVLPPCLTARQRAILHELGETCGLVHASSGDGAERHMRFGVEGGEEVRVETPSSSTLSDAELCGLLSKHLHIADAPALFSSTPTPGGNRGGPAGPSGPEVAGFTRRPHGAASSRGKHQLPQQSVDDFVAQQLSLVEMERKAEVDAATEATTTMSPEAAQVRGRALLNLRVADLEGGLLGRTLITLVANKGYTGGGANSAPGLPPHKFGGHDVVALRPNKGTSEGPPLCQGVIYRVRDTAIVVAVDEVPDEGMEQPLRLEKLANEVTYKRLKTTLSTLGRAATGGSQAGTTPQPGASLIDVAFAKREPRYVDNPPAWRPFNAGLDDSQRAAVSMALAAKDFALVHGPPGTGKTTAVVEIVLQEVTRGSRVLVCAASNIAVDNLVERLVRASPKLRLVRMGHPARLLPEVLDSSLEAAVLRSDNSSLAKDCRKEIKALNSQLLKLGPRERAERRAIRGDLRRLAKEERQRQQAAIQEVIKGSTVIAATLTGLLHPNVETETFDVVVIDEAAQALEAACWAGLLKAPRAVLAGDHLQLPPTIVSEAAAAAGLGRTLFERLQGLYGEAVSEMLTTQYRMNFQIMDWSSRALYDGRVGAHDSVAQHTLAGLVGDRAGGGKPGDAAAAAASNLPVLLLVDTAGCGFEEQAEEEGDSKANPGEAKAVMAHVQRLIKAGLGPSDIGVITPYNAQVALLKELRPDKLHGLEISSVDGFQGREKEAIIISAVRSNPKHEVGFLADRRRMNVAVTRARRHCTLVCDTETLASDSFLKQLVAHFEEFGDYCSAEELVPQ